MARFFIDRPIFAAVISILITLAGWVALRGLPIAQYPPIAPPTVQVDCYYPGASATVVAQTVAAPIEQQVNGVEKMLYMNSQSTNDGSYTLTVTFKPGVNLNLAQVLVQNRVALAMPQLPDVVRQTGVTTRKRSPDILLTISLNSPTHRYDQLYLSNYAMLHLRDELTRIDGVAEVLIFGQRDYSLRVWLQPDLLSERKLTAGDVIEALREQNFQVAAGQTGQPPGNNRDILQLPLSTTGRLKTPEDFGEIVVHVAEEGNLIRLRDVARLEMGARNQDISNRFDGKPTVGLAIFQLPTANALETADMVKAKIKELSRDFPEGVESEIGYDTTPFIRESIHEVFKALRDATLLVAAVVLVFLKGWRPAIIPLIAVPVAIIGTFAAMGIAHFSINNLTLFGLVLAIGIVVDDAIVVVEAVQHKIDEGLAPREAALAAMSEVSGPVIAVGLVLSAVFFPCAFISGIVGQFFRQFALTIAISTILSTINSLTLSPALAALLLPARDSRRDPITWLTDLAFGWFFWLFDRGFRLSTRGHGWLVGRMLRVPAMVLVVYGGLLLLTYWGYLQLPTGFIPSQDKGYLIASLQLPDSASAQRTRDVVAKIEKIAKETPGIKNVNSVAGNSFILSAYGSNFGSMFIILKNFDERRDPKLKGDAIRLALLKRIEAEVPEATVNVFPPPAVPGVGRAGGFKLMVEDRGDVGREDLQAFTDGLVKRGNQEPALSGMFTVYKANSPQLFVDIDREACQEHGLNLADVFTTLQGYLGSRYVNDFNRFGRTWQVIVQADSKYRNQEESIKGLETRNRRGQMVPLASVAQVRMVSSPLVLTRYNMYPAAAINGTVKAGFSTGDGIKAIERLADEELPSTMAAEWSEITYLEKQSSSTGLWVFALAVAFVFLVLAALYESWTLPLAVILVVPMCVLCSIAGVAYMKQDINIFTQVGFVVLVGLACKNAILIVEFAKLKRDAGVDRLTATLDACKLRLRPIIMTSFAFILGVLPLVFASGAGYEMRRALGVAVFSGMLGVTLFGIFLTPVFYFVIDWLAGLHWGRRETWEQLGELALDGVSFGPVRRGAPAAWKQLAPRVTGAWKRLGARPKTSRAPIARTEPEAIAKLEQSLAADLSSGAPDASANGTSGANGHTPASSNGAEHEPILAEEAASHPK